MSPTRPAPFTDPTTMPSTSAGPALAHCPAPLDSGVLLAGGAEVLIRHGAEIYRSRATRRNRLILTR